MAILRDSPQSLKPAAREPQQSAPWLALAVVPAVALLATTISSSAALALLATACVGGGLTIFVTHGGHRLTSTGVYCLTIGLMAGGGSWYWASHTPVNTTRESILTAAMSIYLATGAMYIAFWRRSLPKEDDNASVRSPISPKLAQGIAVIGLLLFLAGALTKANGATLGTLAQAAAEVGVILFSSSLLLSGNVRAVLSPVQAVAISVALLTFYLFVFSGGGRLRLATLVITIAVIAQYRLRTPVKRLAVVALVPTILFFGAIGQSRVAAQAANANYQASASGLGSLVNPLATYGQLIEDGVTGGHGATFVAEAVVVVPRSMWSDKPVQFGQILVQRLHPEAVGRTNLSVPAMDEGEWFYNFSWLGLIPMIAFVGGLLRWVDRRIVNIALDRVPHPGPVFGLIFLATLVGSISDLAWGGLGTWEVRNVQRLIVLLPLLAWCYLLPRHRYAEQPAARE